MSLRVCFVADSGTDVRLVDGLAERTRLRLLARRIAGGREISQQPRHVIDVEVGPPGHLAFALFAVRRLLLHRHDTDVVVVQGYGPTAAFVNLACRLTGRRGLMLVCSPGEAYYRCRRAPDSVRRFRILEYVAIQVFARVNAWLGQGYVVLSPYLASVVAAHRTRRPVAIVPVYGVDRALFRPSTEPRAALRKRLGLPDDLPLVFFSSRVAPEKDAATLLRAVARLAGRGRPVRVLHLSGGHREFAALAETERVADRVIAADAVIPFAPLADYYRASDVCVQASREEGLGFSPLEALACGVPVVASAVGGLNDTIRDGDTGWSVPAGDADALADAIAAALDDPQEAQRRTLRGMALVDGLYERGQAFDAFTATLQEISA